MIEKKFTPKKGAPIKNTNKPTNRLKAEIDGKMYDICTLSWNIKNNELFYFPHYSPTCKSRQTFLNTGQQLSRIGKISFHANNGLIKVVSYDDIKQKEIEIYRDKVPFLPEPNTIRLFLIDSFILDSRHDVYLSVNEFSSNYETLVAEMPCGVNFSLLYLLIPSHFDGDAVLSSPIVNNKDNTTISLSLFEHKGFPVRRIIGAFTGFDLMIIAIPYAKKITSDSIALPKDGFRAFFVGEPLFALFELSTLINK